MIRRGSFAFPWAALLLGSALDSAWAGNVLVVDAGGGGSFTQIQPAVDAAVDGDTILVKSGNYAGFTISDKSVSVVGDAGANVLVVSSVVVADLSSTRHAVLAGMQIHPASGGQPMNEPALSVQGDAGSVRIEACTILGTDVMTHCIAGARGAFLSNSSDVAFRGCTIHGGMGGWGDDQSCVFAGTGGAAVEAQASNVAIYDCTLQGGTGGFGFTSALYEGGFSGDGGRGGAGFILQDSGFAFASGTHVQGGTGGRGGNGSSSCMPAVMAGNGGPGGHGIRVLGSAPPSHCVALLDDTPVGGSGGAPGSGVSGDPCDTTGLPGHPGSAILAPSDAVDSISGNARAITAPSVVRENASFSIVFHGRPGDVVWLYLGMGPAFVFNAPYHGVNLTTMPPVARPVRLGVIPGSGSLTVQRMLPDFGVDSRTLFLQAVFKDTSSARWLGSPWTLVVLDSAY